MKNKKAQMLQQTLVHLILVGLVAGIFIIAMVSRQDNRGLKQELAEKQTALLIDSAEAGTNITIYKKNNGMTVNNVEIKNGKVMISLEGSTLEKGYPFFSKYKVSVVKEESYFKIIIDE